MRKGRQCHALFDGVAGATGLEPAASGVTGRRSNQLSYAPVFGSSADLNVAPCQVKDGVPKSGRAGVFRGRFGPPGTRRGL